MHYTDYCLNPNCQELRTGINRGSNGRCTRCANYWRANHTERPVPGSVSLRTRNDGVCLNPRCGEPLKPQRSNHGRCIICHKYYKRHGEERPKPGSVPYRRDPKTNIERNSRVLRETKERQRLGVLYNEWLQDQQIKRIKARMK